jgi:hypothetical protein
VSRVLVWLLILVLPLQVQAALTAARCVPHGARAPVSPHVHGHAAHGRSAHAHVVQARTVLPDARADRTAADAGIASSVDGTDAPGEPCTVCGACCVSAAVVPASPAVPAPSDTVGVRPVPPAAYVSVNPAPPHPPPRETRG